MNPATHTFRMAYCRVAGRQLGIDMSAIVGIQSADIVHFEESTDTTAVGTITTQGRVIPVYSLARLIGFPEHNSQSSHCLIATDGVEVWGLLTERVTQSVALPVSELHHIPDAVTGVASRWIQGAICRPGAEQPVLLVLHAAGLRPQIQGEAGSTAVHEAAATGQATREPTVTRQLRLLAFQTADEFNQLRLAFSIQQVLEVTHLPPLEPLPGVMPQVLGLTLWRDRPLPVLCWGQDQDQLTVAPNENTHRLAVVQIPECPDPIGVVVGQEAEMLSGDVPASPLTAAALGLRTEEVRAAFQVGTKTLVFPRLLS